MRNNHGMGALCDQIRQAGFNLHGFSRLEIKKFVL